ncbi:MAG: hypothetical protein WD875_00420 [Pirellulales bacterium]
MFAPRQRCALILLAATAIAAAAFGAARLSAADKDAQAVDDAMSFYRVYAPADRIDQWPRGAVRYVPMDRAEFERIVVEIAAEAKSPASREARVVGAKYTSRLEADGSLRGRGELTVIHASSRGVLLDLGACDLSISGAAWVRSTQDSMAGKTPASDDVIADESIAEEATADEAGEAVLGVGVDGRLKLLVERSGTLRFDFTLQTTSQNGRNVTSAAIPSAVATRWLLDVPAEITPSVTGGLIEASDATVRAENDAAPPKATAPTDALSKRRTWRIELGSAGRLELSLGAERPQGEHVVVARHATDYVIAPSGLSLASVLTLDVYQTPLEKLTLRVDGGATLLAARVGDKTARIVDGRDGGDGGRLVTVEFSEPILGVGRKLTLDAITPLQAGTRWRLPRIAPQGLPWNEASARIVVEPPLNIERVWPANAQYASAVSPHAANVKYLAADGAVDLVVAWSKRQIQAATATLLDVGGEARGSAVIDAVFSDAAATSLTGIIHDGWSVESVSSTPPEALADWRVEDQGKAGQRIVVACRPSVSRRAKVVVVVRWRDNPQQRPLEASDLHIIDWSESCDVRRSLVSLAPAQSFQLVAKGSHRLSPLKPDDEAALRLLASHGGQLQFELSEATAALSVTTRRAATPYRGEINVELNCSATRVRETYRVRCTPQGDGLARIVVRLAPAAAEDIVWTDAANSAESISARRLSDDEARAFLIEPQSEAWLLSLTPPRSAAFEIVGERTRKFDGDMPVSLAMLHDADAHTGTIEIHADTAARVGIENRRLTPIPRPDGPSAEFDDVRATFRYVPTRDVLAVEPAVILSHDATDTAAAVAYTCRLVAQIHAGGGIRHRAQFAIENFGRRDVTLDVGEVTTHFEARVDGEIVARGEESGGPLRVPLPLGRRYVTLTLDYSVDGGAAGWFGGAALQTPTIDVPVLRRHWTVFVPEVYGVLGAARLDDRQASWSRRWFGPLARPASEPAFDPTSWQSWLGRSPRRVGEAAARDATLEMLDRMGASLESLAGEPSATWSALATGIEVNGVFVDAMALDRSGVKPWTPLPAAARGGGRTRAAQLLFDANLAIVTDGERFVFTSVADADLLAGATTLDLESLGGIRLHAFWLPPTDGIDAGESLARRMSEAGGERIVHAATWSETTGAFSLPWDGDADTDVGDDAWRGWRRVDLLADGDAVTVRWVRMDWVLVAAWVGLLAAATLAWSFSRRRAVVVVCLAAVAVTALLLDEGLLVFSPILSGVWWGLCIGLALAWSPRLAAAKRRSADSPSGATWRWKIAAAVGVFLFAVLCVVRGWADDSAIVDAAHADGKADGATATIHRVFFPVDDERKPVGDRVYVPEPLFALLERWKLDRQRGPQGWIVDAAVHRIQLDWNADGTSLEQHAATVAVDAHTFEDDALVNLSLAAASETPGDVRLDGALLDVGNYTIGQGRLQIAVAKAGVHRIEFVETPTAVERDGRVGIGVLAVGAAQARLEIDAPDNGPEIAVTAGNGERQIARGRGALAVPLAAARTYRVQWTKTPARSAGENLASTERLWLDVTPGAVALAAEVALRDPGGLPEELRVSVDPLLIPLTATVDGRATTWRRVGGAADQLAFRLSGSAASEARLTVKFQMRSESGVGALRLPRWEPQVSEVRRRWLAVNIDESLEREITAGSEAQPMSVDDFVQGDSDESLPHYAYRLGRGAILWNLSTRRKTMNVQIDQAMAAVAETGRVRIVLAGDIAIRSGDVYEHVLRCDERLKVDRIAVVEDDADRVTFWTQAADGTVQIFLNRRAGTSQRLRLEGHIEAAGGDGIASGDIVIGDIALDGASRMGHRLLLYRTPSVAVAVRDVTGLAERNQEPTESSSRAAPTTTGTVSTGTVSTGTALPAFVPPTGSRLVRDLVARGDVSPSATIQLAHNAPRIDATSIVVVEEVEANAWSVRAEFRGEVTDGMADDLVVDLPGDWIGDAKVDPPMPWTALDSPTGGRRLLVRPVLPLRGRFGFSVSGQIRTPDSRAAPRWSLLDADAPREFLVLPTLWRGRRLGWDLAQMRRSATDEGFSMPRREGARYQAYQIVGERSAATLQAEIPYSRSLEAYVDILATELADGTGALLSTYDLLPSGVASCRVSMPEDVRLVSVVLEDRLAAPIRDGDGSWRIDLESDSLPQRLQILSIADAGKSNDARRQWSAPRLEDARIRRTTWTVATADARPRTDDSAAAAEGANAARMAARADPLQQLWLSAANSSSEYKSSVANRWEVRMSAARVEHRFAAAGASAAETSEPVTGESNDAGRDAVSGDRWNYVISGHQTSNGAAAATLTRQFGAKRWGRMGNDVVFQLPAMQARRFADQLVRDGAAARATVVAAPPKVVERSAIFRRSLSGRRFYDHTTAAEAWTWTAPRTPKTNPPLGRWAIAMVVAAAAVLLLLRRGGRRILGEQCARHPHLALAVAGVFWWLWLWPGWIGWALIAVSIFWAWRMAWPLPKLIARARPSSYS